MAAFAKDDTTLQTKYVEQSLTPSWNELMAWDITGAAPSSIILRVIDFDDMGGDDLIGHCVVPVTALGKHPREEWHDLLSERLWLLFCFVFCVEFGFLIFEAVSMC